MKQYKEFAIPVLALTLICLLMTALMALTYNVTLPAVEANLASSADFAGEMFPGKSFEEITLDGALGAYKAESGEVVILMEAIGYNKSTPMQVAVGFTPDGAIAAMKIVKCEETQGVGTQVTEQGYLDSFLGHTDAEGVDAIGGATYSSKAVKKAVDDAAALFKGV